MTTLRGIFAVVIATSTWLLGTDIQAQEPLYAVTGAGSSPSTLYELDPTTGAVVRTVGPTGFSSITALDFDPITGALYAIAQDQSVSPVRGDLLILDLDTGTGTIVARTSAFTDMGFHPDGRLFGQLRPHSSGSYGYYEIDVATGAVTQLLSFHLHRPGITFDSLGNGLAKDSNSIYSFNPDIPSLTLIRGISGSTLQNTLEFGENDVLYGVTTSNLVTINVSLGTQTIVGPVFNRYTALASQNEQCFVIDAIDDQFSVINDGSTADLFVLGNEKCRTDRPISVVELPGDLMPDRGGLATTDGTKVRYRSATGFVGFEEFTYTAQDAGLDGGDDPPTVDQDTAAVLVEVLQDITPDAVDDAATTLQSQYVYIDVLANDSLGNAPNAVEIETQPANGSVTLQADDTIRYSPNYNFFGEDSFEYRLTDVNGDSDVATVTVCVFFVSGQVPIDIMPSDPGNNLNLRAGPGAGISVAVLSVGGLCGAPNVIDPSTLKFGPGQANISGSPHVKDVDGDGANDLVVKFLTQETGIACGDTQASLSGRTFDSHSISGTDAINTFNCPRTRKRY
jgi:hypothetical protein